MNLPQGILFIFTLSFIGSVVLPAQQTLTDSPNLLVQTGPAGNSQSIYGHEILSSLSIKDSDLHAVTPVPGEKDIYPDFTRELLQVQWRSGDPIDLYIIKPSGLAKPPVVLYLYGYPSETNRFRDNDYCKRVVYNGYAAIGFVSAMTGQRYHDRPMREWIVSQLPEALTKSVHDVQMILQYLAGRSDLDMDHVGFFGQGSGATIAILAAAIDPQIRAVDALQPWGDWPTWLAKSSLIPETERPNYIKPTFLASVAPLDPTQWLDRVQRKTLRLQFTLDDTVTPAPAIQHMKAAAPSSVQVLEYETRHQQYEALGGGRAFDWIKQQVRPASLHSEKGQVNNKPDAQNQRVH
jgi:dienelactone hydrolase